MHLDGDNTSVLAHGVDHVVATVRRAGASELENDDGAVGLLPQRQLIAGMTAEKRAQESIVARVRHIWRQLNCQLLVARQTAERQESGDQRRASRRPAPGCSTCLS